MFTVPDSPENISALPLSSSSILVYWLPPLHPAGQITGYCLHVKTMIGGSPVAARHQVLPCTRLCALLCMQVYPPTLEYRVPGLRSGQPYSFWVTALTAVGEGAASSVVTESPFKEGVKEHPAKITSFSRNLTVALGDQVSLPCRTHGNPAPSRQWRLK